MLQLVAPVQETFTEALEFTSEFTARAWPNLIKHFNPAWVEEALAATGTATIRRRRLPADRTVWLVLGMAVMRDLPIVAVAGRAPTRVSFSERSRRGRWPSEDRTSSGSRTCWPASGQSERQPREIAPRWIGQDLDSEVGMPPRPVLARQFYLITRRCTQRQLLLRPDRETNNAFTYCLIEAALRYRIEVMLTCAMSNHHHTVIYDREGRYPEFVEHFHKLMARSQNALRGRWENFWSSEQVCVVRLVDHEAVMDKLVYTATNSVQDHLVNRVHHWPGVNGLAALLAGRSLRAQRPRHFFRVDGPMPEQVGTRLTIPPEFGPEAEVLAELRERVRAVEAEHEAERRRSGRRVLGRRAVLQQSWRGYPSSVEPRRNLRPQVASRSKWSRIEALLRNRAFIQDYARARDAWREGNSVAFPAGTYWLRRFANVTVAQT